MAILHYLLVLYSSTSFASYQKELLICSSFHYSKVVQIISSNGSGDKYKHCGVSCALALRCPGLDVLSLGALKEIVDVVGPGDADVQDLKADYLGVLLVKKRRAAYDQHCINYCHKYYP